MPGLLRGQRGRRLWARRVCRIGGWIGTLPHGPAKPHHSEKLIIEFKTCIPRSPQNDLRDADAVYCAGIVLIQRISDLEESLAYDANHRMS